MSFLDFANLWRRCERCNEPYFAAPSWYACPCPQRPPSVERARYSSPVDANGSPVEET